MNESRPEAPHSDPVEPVTRTRTPRAARWFAVVQIGLMTLTTVALLAVLTRGLFAAEASATPKVLPDMVVMWGFLAAAFSTAVGTLGAAYAVSHVGAAALGAMGERPEIAGRALIFLGLAEGLAIYGLIVSIMILARLG